MEVRLRVTRRWIVHRKVERQIRDRLRCEWITLNLKSQPNRSHTHNRCNRVRTARKSSVIRYSLSECKLRLKWASLIVR